MKECLKRLWNTLKTMFLNVKLQRVCKSHHLQCITSSKDSEKLEKSLCVSLRALRRHCITHRHDSVIDITKWAQEYFQKPLLLNTICLAICRCQLKFYHSKVHLKWTVSKCKGVLWSDESIFDILVGNHGRRVLRAKEEGDLQHVISVQFKSQHL